MTPEGLTAEHEALLQFLYLTPIGLITTNATGAIDRLNPKAAQLLLPILRGERKLDNLFEALQDYAPEMQDLATSFTPPHGIICENHRIDLRHIGPGPAFLGLTLIRINPTQLMAVLQDLTSLVEKEDTLRLREQNLRRMANTDYLTGVYNRRYFFEHAREAFARCTAHGFPISLIMLDADHFKALNDSRGHEAGDQALQSLAATCLGQLRPGDFIARFGGEEFVLLLPETDLPTAAHLAEIIRTAIEKLSLTASFGVAELRVGIEETLRAADKALYQAKQAGRNRVVVAGTVDLTP